MPKIILPSQMINRVYRPHLENTDRYQIYFGGAGSGCLAEVLLFNPEDRYESIALRREYVAMSRIQLAKDGVDLTELAPDTDETGGTVLRVVNNG